MYIVYLDESGDPNGWNNRQDHFIIGGIAIHESWIQFISEALDEIQAKFFPDISVPIKFHATDINSGVDRFRRELQKSQLQQLLSAIYDVIAGIEYPNAALFATAIHISAVTSADQALHDTFEDVVQTFNSFLAPMNEEGNLQKGLLIIDGNQSTEAKYRALISEFRRSGTQYGYLGNIVDIPYFSQSEDTRLLQLADFCAYAVFRYYERGDDQFLNKIIHRFDRRLKDFQGIDGLKHITARQCDCIACSGRGFADTDEHDD